MGAQQPSVRQVGKYIVTDVIGAGGMGIVYRAQDPAIGRTVAIKMLRSREVDGATGAFDRFFLREMKSTGNLHHKNIVTVYDSGEQDGNPYLVMEYLQGETVSKIISERRPISLLDKLDVIVQVCDGLQYAHDRNVIHRDIKPANVILLSDGTAKLVDFGVARIAGSDTSLVQTGQIVGSLSYMSPEQVNSLPIDGRSDIFSTGVMLYELLTYEVPFKGTDPSSTFVRILRETPRPLSDFIPDVAPALQAVINRALAKSVHERYQSAEEFGFDLLGIQRELKAITVADSLKRAESAMQRGDFERVRNLLQDVVRLDRHNERANRLLREIRQTIQQQQRMSQIGQIRSQAQVALAGGQYEEALACADQALRLDPNDTETINLCEQIRNAISRAKAVRQAVNRAQAALFAGDFDEAKDAVEESLRLDPTDSEARALASMINKELAERSRRAQVQGFVDEARRGIAERKFSQAIDALHRAEELDPTDSNVRELLHWAQRGQEQENRRKYLQEITDQIENALHGGDFSSACTISEMGLQRFPEEPTLVRLRAISERQREIANRRRFVHDQSLAVKALTEQDKLVDAVQVLTDALRKYPGEPNLESLLSITKAAIERQQMEREEAARKKAIQRAEAEARAQLTQQVLNWSIDLRRALDARASLSDVQKNSRELRLALEGKQIEEHARDAASLVLNELNGRIRARDQARIELEQLQRSIKRYIDTPGLTEIESRLLSTKAAFPNEPNIQQICQTLEESISQVREERNRSIAQLSDLAQIADATPTSELMSLQEKARKLSAAVSSDPRVGALLQQIDSSISRRFERRDELLRDISGLMTGLSKAQSLEEVTRIVDRAVAIAGLDSTDDELANRSQRLQAEAQNVRASLESLLGQMAALARMVADAPNVHEAEAVVSQVKELADKRPDFKNLQDAATRVFAEVQGRRIEHDLIVQELEAGLTAVPLVETDEELVSAAARARKCLEVHQSDPTILTLSQEIVDRAETMLRERSALRARQQECDGALRASQERMHQGDFDAALEVLLSVQEQNPDRVDLHVQISILRRAIDDHRAEQERLEEEKRERERAELDARRRQAAIQQAILNAHELLNSGNGEESLHTLRSALEREPGHEELEAALQSTLAEIDRQTEERERLERERIAREMAEAEARARRESAELAIREAGELLALGKEEESVRRLESGLGADPQNAALREALDSTHADIARRRAEQERAERERLERERLERERIAREQAEAAARARSQAAEQANRVAWEFLDQGRDEEAVGWLRSASQADAENPELRAALEAIEAEVARRHEEQDRLERERQERERTEAEARARKAAADQAIEKAWSLLEQAEGEQSVQALRAALQVDPQSSELQLALEMVQEEVLRRRQEQERLERERQERERLEKQRIERERAEAEAHARQQAAAHAINEARLLFAEGREDESIGRLRTALDSDPQNPGLREAIEATQAEIARRRAEQERLDRERARKEQLEKERVEAEARARSVAAEQAIDQARKLLARGKAQDSLRCLRDALRKDEQNAQLQTEIAAIEAEVERQKAEQRRLEEERAERERLARETAEAEARARAEAVAQAIREARESLASGHEEDSVRRLQTALELYPKDAELRSALESIRGEIARQRAERERLERERLERERIAREQAEAEERARQMAAERAVREGRRLLAQGQEEASVQCIQTALAAHPENANLRSELQSLQREIHRRRAERERLERERLEREQIAREKAEAEARARQEAAQLAIRQAQEFLAQARNEEALQRLRTALQADSQNSDLRKALESTQAEVARRIAEQKRLENERLERERLEREQIAREKAEAEARARQEAAELAIRQAQEFLAQARNEEALQRLRTALQLDSQNSDLRKALESTQAEVARRIAEQKRLENERLERERLERERIAREKAEAEARVRKEAAELAIRQAQEFLAQARNEEALQRLRTALQLDSQNSDLRKALESTQAEVARRIAEQKRLENERLERERLERERIAREKAEAEARARQEAAEQAIQRAQKLHAEGHTEESVQHLSAASEQDPASAQLKAALQTMRAELARQFAEKERQEREQRERERITREKAEAEERARVAAAEQAIQKARKLLAKGSGAEALEVLRSALQRDPGNKDLLAGQESARAEIERQRAERERQEKERLQREQAAANTRKEEIERALQQSRNLQQNGEFKEALQDLRAALKRYPDSPELRSAVEALQSEIAKQRAEMDRARSAAKAEEAIQAKTSATGEAPAQEASLAAGIFADPRRRLVAIGGAVLALAIIVFVAMRSIGTTKLQVTFTLSPPDATLKIDGTPWDCSGGKCTHSLSPQDHQVVAEKSGYSPASAVAGPHSAKDLTLRLAPLSVGSRVASLAIISDAMVPGSVLVDGKQVGSLSTQQLSLPDLSSGSHQIQISQNGGTLQLTIDVSAEGTPQVTDVQGLERIPVVAITQNQNRPDILCRCTNAEIRIDGKKMKGVGRDRYSVAGQNLKEGDVTLFRDGQSQLIGSVGSDPHYGMIFIASSEHANANQAVNPPDVVEWKSIQSSKDENTFRHFREKYPTSRYAKAASDAGANLAWERVRNSVQVSDFQTYLGNYPDGPHTADAQNMVASIQRRAQEDAKRKSDEEARRKEQEEARRKADQETQERQAKERADKESAQDAQARLGKERADQEAQQKAAEEEARKRAEHDQQAILEALDTYRLAYSRKDLNSLAAVWPNVPRAQFQKTFKDADKIAVKLDSQQPVINADTATVSSSQTLELTVSGKTIPFHQSRLFKLRRVAGRWIIESDN